MLANEKIKYALSSVTLKKYFSAMYKTIEKRIITSPVENKHIETIFIMCMAQVQVLYKVVQLRWLS